MITGPVDVMTGDEARRLNRTIHLKYMTVEGMRQPDVLDVLSNDDVTVRLQIANVVTRKFKPGSSRHSSWSKPLD